MSAYVVGAVIILSAALSLVLAVRSHRGQNFGSQLLSAISPKHILRSAAEIIRLDAVSGALRCIAVALFFCLILGDSTIKADVPLLFLIVILVIAARFGAAAGSIGTIVSALLFAEFLFPPLYRLEVSNPLEKASLGWMILGGLAISSLFGKAKGSLDQRHHTRRQAH